MDWKEVLEKTIPESLVEKVAEAFMQGRPVTIRGVDRGNGRDFFIEVVPFNEQHCATCQCPSIHSEMPTHPVEKNVKRSKSWHHG